MLNYIEYNLKYQKGWSNISLPCIAGIRVWSQNINAIGLFPHYFPGIEVYRYEEGPGRLEDELTSLVWKN